MNYPKALLLSLAASSLSVVSLLTAMASPPSFQPDLPTPDHGWQLLPPEHFKSVQPIIPTSPQIVEFDRSGGQLPSKSNLEGTLLQVAAQAPDGPRSASGYVEVIEPAQNLPLLPPIRSTASPTGGIMLIAQPEPQPKDGGTTPPTSGIPSELLGSGQSGKTLSGFGINQNKALQGFNPSTREAPTTENRAVSVEPSPGAAPGPTGVLESNAASGVELQRRSPLVVDPRIEGFHFGQIGTFADGGYWFPARVDLDTVISKLSSDNILNVLVIKGPYSVRYGPGFSFLDIETTPTPRFKEGYFDAHGSSSLGYRTNGRGWQGQQSVWGGNADWGFRLSYDLQAAQDYRSGNGTQLPSAYNNQFTDFSYGFDLGKNGSVELRYFHNQQSNVLFPGLLTNIVSLNTDAFTGRLTLKDGPWYDRLTVDTWVNTTLFNGGSANQATRNQIPQLDSIFPATDPRNSLINNAFGPVRLDMATDGYALSYGAREITTWGDVKGFNVSFGADIRVFSNYYNEYDAFNFSVANGTVGNTGMPANLGIPSGRQIDPGLLLDSSIPVGENLLVKVGTRVDFAVNQFLQFGPNVDTSVYNRQVGAPHDTNYVLASAFASSDYKLTDEWSLQSGYGYAQRQPTLTELFAGGAFLGLIQNGFNSIYGNPDLQKEQIHQFDLGVKAKYPDLRFGASAFYAFIPDYITYTQQGPFTLTDAQALGFFVPGVTSAFTPINKLRFRNTNLATMYGASAYGEYDIEPWLSVFGVVNFVAGRDQQINEPLPGIAPLDSRVGFRVHDPAKKPRWGFEYFARMVAPQNEFAASLGEQRTPGFVIHNVRAYWQVRENFLILGGVENIGDLQYREHLDLRTGNGVFQPGVNFYVGMKVNY